MRLFILYIIYGIIAVVLESTWLSGIPTAKYQFDFLLIAVAYLGFSQEWRHAVPIIVIFGILYDAVSSGPFGTAVSSYLLIYTLLRLVITKIAYQSLVSRFAWVAIASVVDKAVMALLLLMWGYPTSIAELVITRAPLQALFDAGVGLILIPVLAWYTELRWSTMFTPKGLVMR
jgi:rod shape-determining protein MreD